MVNVSGKKKQNDPMNVCTGANFEGTNADGNAHKARRVVITI